MNADDTIQGDRANPSNRRQFSARTGDHLAGQSSAVSPQYLHDHILTRVLRKGLVGYYAYIQEGCVASQVTKVSTEYIVR